MDNGCYFDLSSFNEPCINLIKDPFGLREPSGCLEVYAQVFALQEYEKIGIKTSRQPDGPLSPNGSGLVQNNYFTRMDRVHPLT